MPLITVDKARVKQAGNTIIAFGPKFTTLTAPSLAALIGVDTDATIPGTNRHPAVGVDTYILTSQPS